MLALVLSSVSAAPDCAYSKGVRHLYNKAQQKRTEKKKVGSEIQWLDNLRIAEEWLLLKKAFKVFISR